MEKKRDLESIRDCLEYWTVNCLLTGSGKSVVMHGTSVSWEVGVARQMLWLFGFDFNPKPLQKTEGSNCNWINTARWRAGVSKGLAGGGWRSGDVKNALEIINVCLQNSITDSLLLCNGAKTPNNAWVVTSKPADYFQFIFSLFVQMQLNWNWLRKK